MRARRSWPVAAVLLLPGCAADPSPSLADPCAALMMAGPHEWPDRLQVVHALGPAVAPRLVALLRAQPDAPGGRAAIALLARFGDASVAPFLVDAVVDRGPWAVEAALALGDLRAAAGARCLHDAVADTSADATLRTAAACALVQLGEGAAALPLLRAVLLAGSPAGREAGAALGLPVRPRWALERYLIQRLLLHEGQAALARQCDPDASWPELERLSGEFGRWVEQRR